MNRKLKKYMDDIDKVEKRIAEYQEQLETLKIGLKQEQEYEMVRAIRSLNLGRNVLFSVLNGLQDGSMTIRDLEDMGADFSDEEEAHDSDEDDSDDLTDDSYSDNEDEDSGESHWQRGGRYGE